MNHSKTAAVLSLLPGGGQFYNKQWLKGLLYLIATVSFAFAFGDLLNIGLWGIVTLGEQIPRDNSVFLLAEGILAIIILFFGVTLYWLSKDIPMSSAVRQSCCLYLRSSFRSCSVLRWLSPIMTYTTVRRRIYLIGWDSRPSRIFSLSIFGVPPSLMSWVGPLSGHCWLRLYRSLLEYFWLYW